MQTQAFIYENFPIWDTPDATRRPAKRRWIPVLNSYDFDHLTQVWERICRVHFDQHFEEINVLGDPENYRVRGGIAYISDRHVRRLRTQIEFMNDYLRDEHSADRYEFSRSAGDYVRIPSTHRPQVDFDDAKRANEIIKNMQDFFVEATVRYVGEEDV